MNIRDRLEGLNVEKRAWINGRYVPARSGEVIRKRSSIDGTDRSGIAACGEADVDEAVRAAEAAFDAGGWSMAALAVRKAALLRLADLMEDHREELALLDTYETGRAWQNYAEDSLPKAIAAVRYFAEAVDKLYDAAIPPRGSEFGVILREPLGVVGLITPWNDPMVVDAWKYAPALLMGNSVVMKPAEQSSLSLIRLAALTQEAGIPDGVFNVVPGYGETAGRALALHPRVRGVFFTGSAETGKKVLKYAGRSNMKRTGMECGGKGPYIVTKHCRHVREAAEVLAENMFYNQGQICSAPSRVILAPEVRNAFLEALKQACEAYVPGDPYDSENRVGCVVSRTQYERVQGYLDLGVREGAELYQAKTRKPHHERACCFQPSFFTGVTNDMRIAQEEIFGPVAVILEASGPEEAVAIANDSEYGLAGAVWTDDLDEAYWLVRRLRVGLAHINSYGNDDDSSPFGGLRQSGIGKDKSVYAFEEYSDLKSVWMHFR